MPRECTTEEIRTFAAQQKAEAQQNGVPEGHRTKCRSCGALDKIAYKGFDRRNGRCAYCGGTLARRKAPRQPKVKTFVLNLQLDGQSFGIKKFDDLFAAEREAYAFVNNGPVGRNRVAQIVELLDNELTGNVKVLSYNNYKVHSRSVTWKGGCGSCKGRGLVAAVVSPAFGDRKAVIRFYPCSDCKGLGGELTRKRAFGRPIK